MVRFVLCLALVLCSSQVFAQTRCPNCGRVHQQAMRTFQSSGVVQSWGSGYELQIAIQSATYRAQNGIKGHSRVDLGSGRRNGVGWSTNNSQPATCFWGERNRGAYASVRGRDGFYSALVLSR